MAMATELEEDLGWKKKNSSKENRMVGKHIGRRGWGARWPSRPHYRATHAAYELTPPVRFLVFGNTMSAPCYEIEHCKKCVRDIQMRNMDKYQLVDIRYNFLIDINGNRYTGRGWRTIPRLPQKYRCYQPISLYIGFIGFFNGDDSTPYSREMYEAKDELIISGIQGGHVAPKFLELNI